MTKAKAPTFAYEFTLVGLGFRMKREFRKVLAKSLTRPGKSGQVRVHLQREPMNKYDSDAVRVDADETKLGLQEGQHLGYLRAEAAALVAPLMDNREDGGFVFKSAKLIELDPDDDWKTGTLAVEFYDYRSVSPTLGSTQLKSPAKE